MEEAKSFVTSSGIEVDVVVVDSPEKWPVASEVSMAMYIGDNGRNRKPKRVLFRGVSMAQLEAIEKEIPVREPANEQEQEMKEYKIERQNSIDMRKCAILEASTGMKFPGETKEARLSYMRSLPEGDIDAMILFARSRVCNAQVTSEIESQELTEYLTSCDKTVVNIASFDDWRENQAEYVFAVFHYWNNTIYEFRLGTVSASDYKDIMERHQAPAAPIFPVRDLATQQLIPGKTRRVTDDPSYLARLMKIEQSKAAELISKVMPFKIPGETNQEKYDWIASHLYGDVIRLRDFIQDNVIGLDGRFNFF